MTSLPPDVTTALTALDQLLGRLEGEGLCRDGVTQALGLTLMPRLVGSHGPAAAARALMLLAGAAASATGSGQ